jgi:hypothetical protein
VAMSASMLNGDAHVVGALTSGGTESILCAMMAYRDRARKLRPHLTTLEVVGRMNTRRTRARTTPCHDGASPCPVDRWHPRRCTRHSTKRLTTLT